MMKNLIPILLSLLCLTACDDCVISPNEFEVTYGDHPLQSFVLHKAAHTTTTSRVAIMLHGGGWIMGYHPDEPVTTFEGRYNWDLQTPLCEAGFAVVTMKYRTACYKEQESDFGGETRANIDSMIKDINLVIQHLKANASTYNIDADDIQLVGESAGGHIVMYYGISDAAAPEVKSVVSMFGPTNLDAQDFKTLIDGLPNLEVPLPNYFLNKEDGCTSITNKTVEVMRALKSFADQPSILVNAPNPFLDTLSTTFLPNIHQKIPMFITHGVEDELVPFSQAEEMMAAMKSKFTYDGDCDAEDFSCDLKLGKYETCKHGFAGGQCKRNEIMQDILQWLKQHG